MWMALAQLGMAGYGAYQKQKGFKDQISSLNKLKQRSPEEMRYYNDLRQRTQRGGINVQQQINRRMPGIQATQQQTLQSQMGGLYGSGLENSVIADELKRKTHQSTLQQIAQESQAIADANQASQLQASKEMADYGRRRTELLNQIGQQQDSLRSQQKAHLNQTLMSGAVGLAGGIGTMADTGKFSEGIKGMAFGGQAGGYNYSGIGQTPSISQASTPNNLQSMLTSGQMTYKDGQYWILGPDGPVPVGATIPKNFFGGSK